MADTWHLIRDGASLTLTRRLPARFDVVAETRLPDMARGRLAHQVRQDVWRALRHVRGFSPVVEILKDNHGLRVRAGGRVSGAFNARKLAQTVDLVLSDRDHQARWLRNARHKNAPIARVPS